MVPNPDDTIFVSSHDQAQLNVEITATQLTVMLACLFTFDPSEGVVTPTKFEELTLTRAKDNKVPLKV